MGRKGSCTTSSISRPHETTLNGPEKNPSPISAQSEEVDVSRETKKMDQLTTALCLNINVAYLNKSLSTKLTKCWKKRAWVGGVITIPNFCKFFSSLGQKRGRENPGLPSVGGVKCQIELHDVEEETTK